MNIAEQKHGGEIIYNVYIGEQCIARVCKGWLSLGGDQWVVQMADRPAFGEKTLKGAMRRISLIAKAG